MKKSIYLGLFMLNCLLQQVNAQEAKTTSTINFDDFYKHLGDHIKYPEKANLAEAQGNSVILLTIADKKIKAFSVNNSSPELGFDAAVVENLFSFQNFSKAQNGKYALVTAFRIQNSESPVNNKDYIIPKGYTALKVNVIGYGKNKLIATDTTKNDISNIGKGITFRGMYNAEGKSPMVILNDEVIEYPSLTNLEPNKINSVTILKDAASILKYGEEAKNGVIVIITKDYNPKKTIK